MYFDFDDRYSDVEPVGRAINLRDGVVVSVIVHIAILLLLIFGPEYLPEFLPAPEPETVDMEQQEKTEAPRFVFVQPKVDLQAPKPPDRAEMSDIDRQARAVERPPAMENPLPYARGNSSERTEATLEERPAARGPPSNPHPRRRSRSEMPERALDPNAESRYAMQQPQRAQPPPGGKLGDALRNLQKYVDSESFDNPKGGAQEFGPAIQFDTKGVEFGPWIRRFVAQVKRNWFVPYAAMSLRGQGRHHLQRAPQRRR